MLLGNIKCARHQATMGCMARGLIDGPPDGCRQCIDNSSLCLLHSIMNRSWCLSEQQFATQTIHTDLRRTFLCPRKVFIIGPFETVDQSFNSYCFFHSSNPLLRRFPAVLPATGRVCVYVCEEVARVGANIPAGAEGRRPHSIQRQSICLHNRYHIIKQSRGWASSGHLFFSSFSPVR